MRTPTRKPGKYTGVKPDPNITLEKYNKLKTSLNQLIKVDRLPAIKDVKEQAAFGDFSDNAAYSIAKGKLRQINNRILKIKGYLKNAVIIDASVKSDSVQLGSTVTVESRGKTRVYRILGSAEVDISQGVISHNSPLGLSLLGKRKGEVVKVKIKDKEIEFRIVGVG